ncbi:glycosyl transferase [Oenococcus sp. UCMA 16435]|nr:glycosyl transferase [Oenococcus sp. UCMA 16435]
MLIQLFIIVLTIIGMFFLNRFSLFKSRPKYFRIAFMAIIFLAAFVRIFRYSSVMGLNLDEAMGGYNSWSLAHYGVDSALNRNPVYLYAWGTGMNVLYPLISVPFIKLIGLSLAAYRLPMVLLSIGSIFSLFIGMLKYKLPDRLIMLSLATVFLSPWSIMANRWGLESNLFPIIFTFAVSVFLIFLSKQANNPKQGKTYLYIFAFLIALCAYAYSNNWFMLPFFVCGVFGYLYLKKKASLKSLSVSVFLILLIIWPLLLFAEINYFSGKTFRILSLTIPKLSSSRSNSELIIGHGNIFYSISNNIFKFIKLMVTGNDHLIWNSLPQIGILYPFMFIFCIVGIVIAFRKRNDWDNFMLISLLSCLPIIMIIKINANHLNALMLPILYFEALGLYYSLRGPVLKMAFTIVFSLYFVTFSFFYFHADQTLLTQGKTLTPSILGKAIRFANKSKAKKIYITCLPKGGYVIPRFYCPISPVAFNKEKPNVTFKTESNYKSYGKWYFKQPKKMSNNSVLIVKKGQKLHFRLRNRHKKDFGQYRVYY